MIRFEIKKIFSKISSRIALIVLAVLLAVICFNTLRSPDLWYVDQEGETHKGITAARQLKELKEGEAGMLTEERLAEVIGERNDITSSPEYNSSDITQQDIAFARGQGISDIRDLLTVSFCGFGEYDYYRADSLEPADAEKFYENRTDSLEEWLDEGTGAALYSDGEKEYLKSSYDEFDTPVYYEYASGWKMAIESSPMLLVLMAFVLIFLVSGIFPSEYSLKADSVFFAARYGRGKAVRSKIWAGLLVITVIYAAVVAVYTGVILGCLGAGGGNCAIQSQWGLWKSMYNITFAQAYALIVACGYIGSVFIAMFTMFVSVMSRSAVVSVVIPFVTLFLPLYLPDTVPAVIGKILGLFPDKMLQIYTVIDEFSIYSVLGHMTGSAYLLPFLYVILVIVLLPVVYMKYRKTALR
ncbi:MAG TPA: ABC transporter permease [Candidatus Copromorpha excrementavium]|uniref:ABC transporter permease n=1 Tax=Candidatus Allocopromorpha excrementavium TaxID=2840741 RepID=A0A9D1HBI4_9FIRM|nr:ABC transporter permease [Candidatus Copromorpha excrementavium]